MNAITRALKSIADSSCCSGCQEAQQVARRALQGPRMDETAVGWIFTDFYHNEWELMPTQTPDMPLTIVLRRRG